MEQVSGAQILVGSMVTPPSKDVEPTNVTFLMEEMSFTDVICQEEPPCTTRCHGVQKQGPEDGGGVQSQQRDTGVTTLQKEQGESSPRVFGGNEALPTPWFQASGLTVTSSCC